MSKDIKDFADSALGFTKSPLGIIALFMVLVYALATLGAVVGENFQEYVQPLVYFLVGFPVLVFLGFLWLVAKHHDKLYGPSDFKNEENFFRQQMSTVASLAAARAKKSDDSDGDNQTQSEINAIIDIVSKTPNAQAEKKPNQESWKTRILWVDDTPENNVFERQAFETQGMEFTLAKSTQEALSILDTRKFAVIISDTVRGDDPGEGYVLLERIRGAGDKTPFFIYSGSMQLSHMQMAEQMGATGSTMKAQALFEMVMKVIEKE